MLKNKKFFPIITFFTLLTVVFSCSPAKDPYDGKIVIHSQNETRLNRILDNFPKEYDVNDSNKNKIDPSLIKVTFNNEPLELYTGEDETKIELNKYFVTRSESTPIISFVKPKNYTLTSNADQADMSFYVGALIKDNDGIEKIFTSEKITITVKNAKALKPWVWFTVSGVVIFLVVGMIFFTRRYKDTHQGNKN